MDSKIEKILGVNMNYYNVGVCIDKLKVEIVKDTELMEKTCKEVTGYTLEQVKYMVWYTCTKKGDKYMEHYTKTFEQAVASHKAFEITEEYIKAKMETVENKSRLEIMLKDSIFIMCEPISHMEWLLDNVRAVERKFKECNGTFNNIEKFRAFVE